MMNILIVEDDFTSRRILQRMLSDLGPCDIAVTGPEAVQATREAIETKNHYRLICLDIQMPGMDGHQILREIRKLEEQNGFTGDKQSTILITSVLNDGKTIMKAFRGQCDGYLPKPFDQEELFVKLEAFGLLNPAAGAKVAG